MPRSPTRGENKMASEEGKRGAQRKEASRHVTKPTHPRIGCAAEPYLHSGRGAWARDGVRARRDACWEL